MPKTIDYAQAQRDFRNDGYVAISGFLGPDEVADARMRVQRFIADKVPTMPASHVFYEDMNDKSTLKQLQKMFEFDSYFHTLMFDSAFTHLARELLSDDVVCWNMQYFNKPPGVGQPTPAHQDGFYLMLEPCEALTMWLALDPVDEENGCVRYVRGSHLDGMRPHARTQTLGFSQGITDYGTPDDQHREVPFPAQPGDLLAHHALTIHRADGNRSATRTRQALGFIYVAASAKPNRQAQDDYQRNLTKEMQAIGKL